MDANSIVEELVASFMQTVAVLGKVAIALERWHEGSHSSFVSQKASAAARLMGLEPADIVEIETAGRLHDIGKIGLPDTICAKAPSDMSLEEFRAYSSHPENGRLILSPHTHFDSIGQIIAQHHEKYDGTGFPGKLRGDQIHIGAALIAVADFYHNGMHRKYPGRATQTFIPGTGENYVRATEPRFANVMNALHNRSKRWFAPEAVDTFTSVIEAERRSLGIRTITRVGVNQLKPGMFFADDYYASYGLLLVARGEPVSEESLPRLVRLAEIGELPQKILVMR